ncbi:hypothetical protein ACFFX0_28495 [Citricoccus parietis]|uniref:Uncharacterized protein n=1 Tax=Citricoccus parietis TaxID=592307 RepID=A0ABV5FSR1_9MICC
MGNCCRWMLHEPRRNIFNQSLIEAASGWTEPGRMVFRQLETHSAGNRTCSRALRSTRNDCRRNRTRPEQRHRVSPTRCRRGCEKERESHQNDLPPRSRSDGHVLHIRRWTHRFGPRRGVGSDASVLGPCNGWGRTSHCLHSRPRATTPIRLEQNRRGLTTRT